MPISTLRSSRYRPDIDGLRAVAISFVLLFHAFPKIFPGGFIGVDVFFVLSGFLISDIIFRNLNDDTWSIVDFYSRRIRRIFPALVFVLLVVLCYGYVIFTPSELAELGKNVVGGAAFVANLIYWSEAGYFDKASVYKPLLHLWSLGVEEQFYFIWPLMIWAVYRARLSAGLVLSAVTVASLIASLVLASTNPTADFYSPFTRVWQLSSGGLLALWLLRGPKPPSQTKNPSKWIGHFASAAALVLLVGAALLLNEHVLVRGIRAILSVGCTLLLVAAGSSALVNVGLSTCLPVFLGRISYPIYLWHWPLLSIATIVRGRAPTPLLALSLITASVLLGWLTAKFVEKSFRFGPHPRQQTLVISAAMAVTALFGVWTWRAHVDATQRCGSAVFDASKIDAAINDDIFRPTLDMSVRHVDKITIAKIGSGPTAVLLTGDSSVFQYGPRVQKLFEEGRLAKTVYFVVGQSCSPIPGAPGPNKYATCSAMARIKDDLIRDAHVSEVVFGANWVGYRNASVVVERDGIRMPAMTPDAIDRVYRNLADDVQRLESRGVKVSLILSPAASESFNPIGLISRSVLGYTIDAGRLRDVSVASLRANTADDDRHVRAIARATGVGLLDPIPDVCGDGPTCPILFEGDRPKFSDSLHLRPNFVRDHVEFLDKLLTVSR